MTVATVDPLEDMRRRARLAPTQAPQAPAQTPLAASGAPPAANTPVAPPAPSTAVTDPFEDMRRRVGEAQLNAPGQPQYVQQGQALVDQQSADPRNAPPAQMVGAGAVASPAKQLFGDRRLPEIDPSAPAAQPPAAPFSHPRASTRRVPRLGACGRDGGCTCESASEPASQPDARGNPRQHGEPCRYPEESVEIIDHLLGRTSYSMLSAYLPWGFRQVSGGRGPDCASCPQRSAAVCRR